VAGDRCTPTTSRQPSLSGACAGVSLPGSVPRGRQLGLDLVTLFQILWAQRPQRAERVGLCSWSGYSDTRPALCPFLQRRIHDIGFSSFAAHCSICSSWSPPPFRARPWVLQFHSLLPRRSSLSCPPRPSQPLPHPLPLLLPHSLRNSLSQPLPQPLPRLLSQ